ncbi:MAG TPA: biopolymer transporter ExbD [Gammaproteobacteria bacterium]|nr:biopolymer transporter ExbD [Gammaproteobacteria bacterium]
MGISVNRNNGDEADFVGYKPMAEINVTPLVDVMLVLLIIFMVAAPLMMAQLPIEMPEADLEDMGKPKEPLVISIDMQRQYYIGDDKVDNTTLMARLSAEMARDAAQTVYVRGDKGVSYGEVIGLLSMVSTTGFTQISLMTEAPQ